MSRSAVEVAAISAIPGRSAPTSLLSTPPKRTAPFNQEPGLYEPASLWLYGNARLLDGHLAHVERALGSPVHSPDVLDQIERAVEELIFAGNVLVSGIHNAAHMRAAVVPLRWGSPRILVLSGGFEHHLGPELDQEPFRTARLWRYKWDPTTDLVVSRRAPDKLPTYARYNPTVDHLIVKLVNKELRGCLFGNPEF